MGRVAGAISRIYLDENNMSGRTNNAELAVDLNLPEVTSFSDSAAEFVEGLYSGKISQNSFFDGASGEIDGEVFSAIGDGNTHYLGLYPGNDASHGDIGYEATVKSESQPRPIEVAGAVLLNVTWQATGPIVRASVLCNTRISAAGVVADSNKNLGTTTSGEVFVAVVRILDTDYSGGLNMTIEQSSDDGSGDAYATLISFTNCHVTKAQRKSVSTATEAWKRVNITAVNTGTYADILIVVGKEQGVS